MKHLTTRQLVELSLYAALIFVSVQCLRIPMVPNSFILEMP